VVYNTRLVKTIRKYDTEILSMAEVEKIYNKILNANITNKSTKNEHVNAIKSNVEYRKAQIRNNICPKCGGDLVDRKGKFGKFKGCSNYPKCRYTG